MKRLDDYISAFWGAKFQHALPGLRRQLGAVDWSARTPNCGIAGSTFRAYQGWKYPPSQTFRGWAQQAIDTLDPHELANEIASTRGFSTWHSSLLRSLGHHWQRREGRLPPLAHQLKLVDLFVKWLSGYNVGGHRFVAALEKHARCALDSQTLRRMNECYSQALPLGEPSMGSVISQQTYDLCQELIARFSRMFGGTPLLFDYFAWTKGGSIRKRATT